MVLVPPAGHAAGTLCLDLSPDGALLASAGVDAHGRQELALWDVSACWQQPAAEAGPPCRAVELARQASEHNVQAVRFLPHDSGRLVTCGKNSIRVWR
jgi:WD40 repeat protein